MEIILEGKKYEGKKEREEDKDIDELKAWKMYRVYATVNFKDEEGWRNIAARTVLTRGHTSQSARIPPPFPRPHDSNIVM